MLRKKISLVLTLIMILSVVTSIPAAAQTSFAFSASGKADNPAPGYI